jgi:hypothetical protein
MKLLFISGAQWPDYLCGMLPDGFRSLLGAEAVGLNYIWYLCRNHFGSGEAIPWIIF